jgi:hypothetical protein
MTALIAEPQTIITTLPKSTVTNRSNSNAREPVPDSSLKDWTRLVFARLSQRHEHSTGAELLTWAIETFGSGLSIGTGLGASGIVLVASTCAAIGRTLSTQPAAGEH